jgi:alpha-tubulin suppressor-like RCC1 family protein
MLGFEANDCNPMRTVEMDLFQDFYLGSDHGLALDDEGKLFSFGDAGNGALGNGDKEEQKFYLPAPVPGLGKTITAATGNH